MANRLATAQPLRVCGRDRLPAQLNAVLPLTAYRLGNQVPLLASQLVTSQLTQDDLQFPPLLRFCLCLKYLILQTHPS